jgi:DNA-binding transcriptional LysR family regulator
MHLLAVLPQKHRARRAVLEVAELADEPLLRLTLSFASHGLFEAAYHVARIRPRVLLESVAPQTLIAVRIPRTGVRVAVVVHRGVPIGRWTVAAWDPQRFLPPYATRFIEELVSHCKRGYPGREFVRRAPSLPKPAV